jgi:hypothetical protein
MVDGLTKAKGMTKTEITREGTLRIWGMTGELAGTETLLKANDEEVLDPRR